MRDHVRPFIPEIGARVQSGLAARQERMNRTRGSRTSRVGLRRWLDFACLLL